MQTFLKDVRAWSTLCLLLFSSQAFAQTSGTRASCVADQPPNDQPASGQRVSAEFCVKGAAGQHYYLWSIPATFGGRKWKLQLEALPGENAIFMVQSLDRDPKLGAVNSQTLWRGQSSADNATVATPALQLEPGLYGVVASTEQPPGLFRVYSSLQPAASDGNSSALAPNPAAPAIISAPVASPPGSVPALTNNSVAQDKEILVPWSLDSAAAANRWLVVLQSTAGANPTLRLLDKDKKEITLDRGRREKGGILHYPELALPSGNYMVAMTAKAGSPLTLKIYSSGARDAFHVSAPNTSPESAFVFDAKQPVTGLFVEKGSVLDQAFVALNVDDSLKNKRFDLVLRVNAQRSERIELAYVLPNGDVTNNRGGSGEVRVGNLTLAPGHHVFRLNSTVAEDLPYALSVENIAPRAPGEESEPNDIGAVANLIPADGTISGESDGDSDYDFFRFHSEGPPQLWTISCDGKGVEWLTLLGADGDGLIQVNQFPNDHAQMSGVLLAAGDHLIRLRSTASRYVLKVTRQSAAPVEAGGHPAAYDAPTTVSDEIEPNDEPARALPLALDSSRGGLNDRSGDQDYYRFTLLGYTHVRLTLDDGGLGHRKAILSWGSDQRPIATLASSAEQRAPFWDGVLAAGDYYVVIKCDDTDDSIYRLRLASKDPFETHDVQAVAPAVHAELTLTPTRVAAFAPRAQSVNGTITIASKASAPLDLSVIPYVADERWHATASISKVHLEPGANATATLAIQVAPQAWADHPIQIGIGLRDATGGHVSALTTLAPTLGAPEINPIRFSEIPQALVGGLNVAWSALGGQSRDAHPELIDGLVTGGGSLKLKKVDAKQRLTVALGGSSTTKLKGFALVPAGSVPAGDRLRHFRLSSSIDGTQFTPLISGELSSRTDPQYFVLDKPIDARFVGLDMLDAHDSNASTIAVAEFMAISDPQSPPSTTLPTEISSLLFGGHVVWMDPHPFASTLSDLDAQTMLSAAPKRVLKVGFSPGNTTPLSWAVGFLDDRATRIDSLEWSYPNDEAPADAIPSVQLFGSTVGPRGPWASLGTWKIAPQGASTPFKVPGQPSLRFMKFVAAASKTGYSEDLPSHVAVRAAVVANERPIFALAPAVVSEIPNLANQSADKRLALDASVQGFVRLDARSDHWIFDNSQGPRSIVFTLANKPSISATLSVKSLSGNAVPLTESAPSPDLHQYKANLAVGSYTVDVSEPPVSIALSWDTSDSVRIWLPSIIAAARSVAQDASPGRVEFNLFPFRDPATQGLLKEFSGDPATLFSALQFYDWHDNSSSAETALLGASEALKTRIGRRAIILLTDAETSSLALTGPLWNAMDQTGAQIFALAVPTATTGEMAWRSHNLMMDWATTSGGFMQLVGDQGALEASFKRAVSATRTGSPYALSATALAPQGPGTLSVSLAPVSSTQPATSAPSVALVLDASGSMLQKIKGRQKIEIARTELDHLVRDVLPEATPVTLRVYGQGGRGSCTSDLMMSLAPLDRQRAERIVANVRSTDGAKTATAASLRATAQDLSAAPGAKRIVLITDGQENCGGDVEKEIADLRRSGFDLQVSIIGFAIDSPQSGAMFKKWAQLGGGSYYETRDAATLDSAMTNAIRPQFDVLDDSGKTLVSGPVGSAPITLASGRYSVRLHGSADAGTPIEIQIGKNSTVTLTP